MTIGILLHSKHKSNQIPIYFHQYIFFLSFVNMQDFLFSKGIRISLWRNWKLLCQLVGHCIMSHVRQRSPRCLNKNRRSERSADNMGSQDCSNILMASNNIFLSSSYLHSQDCSNILMASINTFLSSSYLHFQDCSNILI